MEASQLYIIIAIIVFAVIAIIVFFLNKKRGKKPAPVSTLTHIAFLFILAGIFFGENRAVGYSLLGTGVVLAVIDMIRKSKKK